jgi:hypothetical protein
VKAVLIVLGALAVVAVVAAVVVGLYFALWYSAPARGALDARETIQGDGDFRIQAYNHFFNLCSDVQGLEGAHDATLRQLDLLGPDSDDRNRVVANLTGIESQRARSIADYNADARKNWTSGQFRDEDLPYQLSLEGDTSCGKR